MSEELRPDLVEVVKEALHNSTDTSPCYNRGFMRGYKLGFETCLAILRTEIDADTYHLDEVLKYWHDQASAKL